MVAECCIVNNLGFLFSGERKALGKVLWNKHEYTVCVVLALISVHLWTLHDRPVHQVIQASLDPSLLTTQCGHHRKKVVKLEQQPREIHVICIKRSQ